MKLNTLVLNVNFVPIGILSWQRSLVLSLEGMDVVEYYDTEIKDTVGRTYRIPSVIRTNKFVKISFSRVRLNNKNLFARDKCVCQYCGQRFSQEKLTCDHIIPKSKWKANHNNHCWTNVVTACFRCNNKKADKSLKEAGLDLLRKPLPPKMIDIVFFNNNRRVPPAWKTYLV
jgi:5-methylcytosine-specific restriction endonuclease McrA